MASAAGLAVGLLLLIIIIVCGVLLWYYYKKRKQREVDKLPLQKAQPANKRLVNGDLYRDGRVTGSKTPRAMNGDVKVNVEDELGVRRENSIHISMTSRGGSGLGGLDGDRRQGVAPVEEPELAKNAKAARAAPSDKYVVDRKGSEGLQRPDKGSSTASASGERRRFGDPPAESARKNRKRTPRLRHPMEIQGDSEEVQDKKESFKKAEEFWKDEKRARSGRRREHPEALTIPSLKEDPFDHRDDKPPGTPSFSQARSGKSAVGMRLERENSAFIAPVKDPASDENLWQRASNLWHHSNNHKPIWNNLALHH
ncbi:uncharacterized protein LOC128557479 isoform X2 [Mercenaria mercenaria]|uniref:uncharacterized protein LOC128557479 isoform X2 n=1 Tax=Mercenaria mercenaria TaxID=6596 RepID=UPI00234E799C|nr:uncharacterized protein LOC128557479 isoform X2 [Mercenaria mercenaria]